MIEAVGEVFGRQVVHLEGDDAEFAMGELARRQGAELRRGLEGEDAQAVRDPGQLARAEAGAAAREASRAGRGGFAAEQQVTRHRRARWGDPLARHAVVDRIEALQQQRRRGRRHGQDAMRRPDPAGAERQRRRGPALDVEQRDQLRRRHDVDDGIDGADLVERHRVDRHAVDLALRLGEAREDRDRLRLDPGVERRAFDQRPDGRPGPVVVTRRRVVMLVTRRLAVMVMIGPAVVVAVLVRSLGVRLAVGLHQEAPPREAGRVAMVDEPDRSLRPEIEAGHGALDGGEMVGEGVEQGGDEHVARPAAERIQMNIQPRLRHASTFTVRQR